jgi:hypothetical protein
MIGRIFAHWGDWLLYTFFDKYKSSSQFWATFVHGKGYAVILTKNGLGHILGDFFKNSSGHPDRNQHVT